MIKLFFFNFKKENIKYYTNIFETNPTTDQIIKKRIQTKKQKKAQLKKNKKIIRNIMTKIEIK
jgi:hypothetical protein